MFSWPRFLNTLHIFFYSCKSTTFKINCVRNNWFFKLLIKYFFKISVSEKCKSRDYSFFRLIVNNGDDILGILENNVSRDKTKLKSLDS